MEAVRLIRDVAIMFMWNNNLGSPHATATQYIYVDDVSKLWKSIKGQMRCRMGTGEDAIRHVRVRCEGPERLSSQLWSARIINPRDHAGGRKIWPNTFF